MEYAPHLCEDAAYSDDGFGFDDALTISVIYCYYHHVYPNKILCYCCHYHLCYFSYCYDEFVVEHDNTIDTALELERRVVQNLVKNNARISAMHYCKKENNLLDLLKIIITKIKILLLH